MLKEAEGFDEQYTVFADITSEGSKVKAFSDAGSEVNALEKLAFHAMMNKYKSSLIVVMKRI